MRRRATPTPINYQFVLALNSKGQIIFFNNDYTDMAHFSASLQDEI